MNLTDVGGPAAMIFSTTITTEGSTAVAVLKPGLIAVFALGLAGIGFGRWAHNRRIEEALNKTFPAPAAFSNGLTCGILPAITVGKKHAQTL